MCSFVRLDVQWISIDDVTLKNVLVGSIGSVLIVCWQSTIGTLWKKLVVVEYIGKCSLTEFYHGHKY